MQIFRVKVRQIWSESRFGTQVQVWSESDLAWHDVAQVLRREPEWGTPEHQWSNRGYTMPARPGIARATEGGMEAVEAEARSISLNVVREALKRASWVLFGVNETPEITTLTEQ